MKKRLTFFAVIEVIILLFLCVALFRNGFILFLGGAIFFSWLSSRSHSRILGIICILFWVISIIHLLRSGYFWLSIAFPVIVALVYFRHHRTSETSYEAHSSYNQREKILAENQVDDNELIDLADLHYHPEGNNLSIRKSAGNTKIVVPEDVEVVLSIKVRVGVVKVFDQMTEINDVNLHYFTPEYESAKRRVAINIKVDSGNVELVRG
ncbi:MAG: cell wall-active antibiotics response protein LiaF [Streptococcaceae bacterium]|jgi:predicted membrane protein|nr:cell wall-active antibiotics response protein LiaF [Streptococcaceae bacterium]